jgi:hypothetical protein
MTLKLKATHAWPPPHVENKTRCIVQTTRTQKFFTEDLEGRHARGGHPHHYFPIRNLWFRKINQLQISVAIESWLEQEIAKHTGQNPGGHVMNDGAVTGFA